MKYLILLRHAKSSWKDPHQTDHERPLNKRGKSDAPLMAAAYKAYFPLPDLILCSTAVRTVQTAGYFLEKWGTKDLPVIYDRNLYHADAFSILNYIGLQDDNLETLMIVGHNPGLTVLANILKPGITDNIPTCGIVGFQIQYERWSAFQAKENIDCIGFITPKALFYS
jgi:phosphohistidine phosphatase